MTLVALANTNRHRKAYSYLAEHGAGVEDQKVDRHGGAADDNRAVALVAVQEG